MDFRSAVRHSRLDHEGQCGRDGQVVESCGPSSDEFATSPHFHGDAICPNTRDFFRCCHRKLDDSVTEQTSAVVDSDEEPLLPQEHELSSLRSPPHSWRT